MKQIAILLAVVMTLMSVNLDKPKSNEVVLSKDNFLILDTDVNDTAVAQLLEKARVLDGKLPKGKAINLILNTPGGSIVAGFNLIEGLKGLNRPINTLVIFAASMGFQIAQQLNQRNILNTGEFMSHRAKGSFGQLEFGGQEPSQYSNRYNSWLKKIKDMDSITVQRTKGKQTLESYQKAYENELWVTGQDAVAQGYADRVVTARCDSSIKGTYNVPVNFFGMVINLKFSNCPLITGVLDISLKIKTNKNTLMTLEEYLKEGGQFGQVCIMNNTLLCPADLTLTKEALMAKKEEVVSQHTKNHKDKIIKY